MGIVNMEQNVEQTPLQITQKRHKVRPGTVAFIVFPSDRLLRDLGWATMTTRAFLILLCVLHSCHISIPPNRTACRA
jgi:hypothetical protein